jgi:hypothetical protein
LYRWSGLLDIRSVTEATLISGAKEMLLVEDIDSKEYLTGLFNAMYDELPVHKSNNKKKSLNDQSIIVG